MMSTAQNKSFFLLVGWGAYGALLLLGAVLAIPLSGFFGYDTHVVDMPLMELFLALVLITSPFVALPLLIDKTILFLDRMKNRSQARKTAKTLFLLMLAIGFAARFLMLFSEPLMEDDYQRYLWDGALSANGHNPYRHSPDQIFNGTSGQPGLDRLAERSGAVLERVNHPTLRTIYPPIAQLGFALAYVLEPFSLTAWRGIALALELATLALLLVLLRALNRAELWVALYWLNPLVIKELVNSGHMEVMLVPLLLGALWATIRARPVLTALLLALAVGVKVWPALLVPLYFRSALATPKKLVIPALVFIGLVALMAWPVLVAGLDQGSGFVAYVQNWKTNSALFPALEALVQNLLLLFSSDENAQNVAALTARGLIALSLGTIALLVAWQVPKDGNDLARKTLFLTATMFLLSPAQLPWYALWFLPFMVFYPLYGLALLVPALQFYYLSFYFAVENNTDFFANIIVWLFWIPVWSVLAFELSKKFRGEHS